MPLADTVDVAPIRPMTTDCGPTVCGVASVSQTKTTGHTALCSTPLTRRPNPRKTTPVSKLTNTYSMVSALYRALPHAPNRPLVRDSYAALKAELWDQFQLLSAFAAIEFTTIDPYPPCDIVNCALPHGSAAMFEDLTMGRLSVYTVAVLPVNHPFADLAPNGQTYNSVFRAVHDGLAHYPGRHGFGPVGEYRAWLAHRKLIRSPLALGALAMETVGQTAVYTTTGHYAEQKANILAPSSVSTLTASLLE